MVSLSPDPLPLTPLPGTLLAGMPKTAGCDAVADAFHRSQRVIRDIYRRPYSTIPDLAEHGMERLDPSFYSSPFEAWLQLRSLLPHDLQPAEPLSFPPPPKVGRFASTASTPSIPRHKSPQIGGRGAVFGGGNSSTGWKQRSLGRGIEFTCSSRVLKKAVFGSGQVPDEVSDGRGDR